MTKCDNCGQLFSDAVYPLHIQRCNPETPVENNEPIVPEQEVEIPETPVENEQQSKKSGKKK